MIELYRKGVEKLRKRPEYYPASWMFQARIHDIPQEDAEQAAWDRIFDPAQSNDPAEQARIQVYRKMALDEDNGFQNRLWATCPHSSLQGLALDFLSWHRLYLHLFETMIEEALGETFALPYWDYTKPGHNVLPLPFREEINGSQKNNPLYFEERRPDVSSLSNPKAFDTDAMPWRDAATENDTLPDFQQQIPGFAFQLEQTPHGDIHMFVGTDKGMAVTSFAARDPIFWLHHSNIDRLWESWRKEPGKADPTSDPWLDRKHRFANSDGTPVEMTVRQAMDTRMQLGYEYDELDELPVAPVIGSLTAAAASEPSVFAMSEKNGPAVTITGGLVELTLKNQPGGAAALTDNQNRNYELVLKGINAETNPVTRFEVYLNLPENPTEGDYKSHRVGSFNLFGQGQAAFGHAHGTQSPLAAVRRFDVDRELLGGGDTKVTIRPIDQNVSVPVTVKEIVLEAK